MRFSKKDFFEMVIELPHHRKKNYARKKGSLDGAYEVFC